MRICVVRESGPRLLALTAMLLTLGFAGVDDGIVLCFGGDGHVAIEAVGPGGCAEIEETANRAASAIATIAIPISSSHCGPCVDVALTSSTATEGIRAAEQTPSAPAAISIAELRPPAPHLRASISYQHTTRLISEKHHTVVIRC